MFWAKAQSNQIEKKSNFRTAGMVYAIGKKALFDQQILICTIAMLFLSLVMIYTASIYVNKDVFFYVKKQAFYIFVGGIASLFFLSIPISFFKNKKIGLTALLFGLILLILPMFFGDANGAKRWVNLGIIKVQTSEIFKLIWIVFLSNFLARHLSNFYKMSVSIKIFFMLFLFVLLLQVQHDLGSAVVLAAISIGMMWMSNVNMKIFFTLLAVAILFGGPFLLFGYRIGRIETFVDLLDGFPQMINDSNRQIYFSFLSLGQGELYGRGLGESLLKLSYLPERHTDLIASIWGEETGFVGIGIILLLEGFMIFKLLFLGMHYFKQNKLFEGNFVFGVGVLFFAQTFINLGSASGLTPAKGLTLPLLSYGGSSLVMLMCSIAIVLRITYEERYGLMQDYKALMRAAKRAESRKALKEKSRLKQAENNQEETISKNTASSNLDESKVPQDNIEVQA